jgi:mycoredoxin
VPTTRRNIWEDAEAAAVVRGVTGGDETVPTVVVGQHAMVNPSPRALEAAIEAHAPALLPDGPDGSDDTDGRGSPGRWWEWRTRSG